MKKHLQFIASTAFIFAALSPHLLAAELAVEVTNVQQIKGSLYISLYKDRQGFNSNNDFVRREKVSVDKNTIHINFSDLPVGEYALKAYQDVNENGKMDFNGVMPTEPYGSSSTSKALSPPDFTDAKFTLDKSQTVQVQLLK